MTAWNTIAVPFVGRDAIVEELLDGLESGAPYREQRPVVERVEGRDFHEILFSREDHAPTCFAVYERVVASEGRLATFVELDGRFDLALAAALSGATGAFVIAAESWRDRGRAGLAMYWGGAPLETRVLDAGGEALVGDWQAHFDVDSEYRALVGHALGLDPGAVYPKTLAMDDTIVDVVRVGARPSWSPSTRPAPLSRRCTFFPLGVEGASEPAVADVEIVREIRTSAGRPLGAISDLGPEDAGRLHVLSERLAGPVFSVSAGAIDQVRSTRWKLVGKDGEPREGSTTEGLRALRAFQGFGLLVDARAGELRFPVGR